MCCCVQVVRAAAGSLPPQCVLPHLHWEPGQQGQSGLYACLATGQRQAVQAVLPGRCQCWLWPQPPLLLLLHLWEELQPIAPLFVVVVVVVGAASWGWQALWCSAVCVAAAAAAGRHVLRSVCAGGAWAGGARAVGGPAAATHPLCVSAQCLNQNSQAATSLWAARMNQQY